MADRKTTNQQTKVEGAEKNTSEKQTCFVIMPFNERFNKYYTDVYRPAIESAGLIAKRADDFFIPGHIVNDIWNLTKKAAILLADLTDKNPNVFYELGLAHAITKPVVLVTESISDVPFDLRSLRVIDYDKNDVLMGSKLTKSSYPDIEAHRHIPSIGGDYTKLREDDDGRISY